ncbi:cyclic nucleotide-gated ion channel 1-like [Malus sylvestris]|uniref:cyclic nucleotide-gated ion channel 1-like n=1 Tax=Malus sylvestris TaxID=3752 RepID=UPI0021AC7B38|nr:cyclic nucleotide-gated ion channel 1-like [Malus sylvestris]
MANAEIAEILENTEEKAEVILFVENSKERAEATLHAENQKETAEANLPAKNPKEEVKSSTPDSNSKDMKEISTVEHNNRLRRIWSSREETDEEDVFFKYWGKIIVASCLCGVLVDPLFLYIPIIKDDIKCLDLDQKLKIAALILRSFTDLFYILTLVLRGIYEFLEDSCCCCLYFSFIQRFCEQMVHGPMRGSIGFLIDSLAVVPLPQVVMLIFFSNMRDLSLLTTRRMFIMNLFVILQYVLRVIRIYFSCNQYIWIIRETEQISVWTKATLNFFMYIIASHAFGALWYFFAIQRMMDCWHSACREEDGCVRSSFGCDDNHIFRNITNLNDLCPINPSDPKKFDLGIFTSVLESGITGSTNYFQKFSNCFWWGLRNLSSLGSNLEPSIDGWENLFAASISIIGLLLFIYLIGNIQMYLQFEAAKTNARIEKRLLEKRKMVQLCPKIMSWLSENCIPSTSHWHRRMKMYVKEKVREAVEENVPVNLEYIIQSLPPEFQRRIKNYPLTKLNQEFRWLDERVLQEICQHLKPKKFKKNDIIIELDKTLKMMVFIVDGLVHIENSDGICNDQPRVAGELCGEALVESIFRDQRHTSLLALQSAKAIRDVEALVIVAEDLESIYSRFIHIGFRAR